MSRKAVGACLAVAGSICLVVALFCMFAATTRQPVSAAGDGTVGVTIPWATVLTALFSLFGGGSLMAAIQKLLGTIQQVVPNIHIPQVILPPGPSPVPNPSHDITTDTVEVVEAVIGYIADRQNPKAERRFAIAVMTELADVASLKSQAVATKISELGQVIVAEWFPPTGATK